MAACAFSQESPADSAAVPLDTTPPAPAADLAVADPAALDRVLALGAERARALAERLDAPVCVGYQHNDAFPGSHPLFAGPLGYNGSKAGMELIAKADVVLALGTRLNPFSTLPG